MELNREQIQNDFYKCLIGECHLCTYYTRKDCKHQLMSKVVALINEQERKIKELTEGKYDIECSYNSLKKDNERLHATRTELTRVQEENERLRAENEIKSQKRANIFEITNAFERGRTDGVRKMQERIKAEKFHHKNFGYLVYLADIDRIAKEMLEEGGNKND